MGNTSAERSDGRTGRRVHRGPGAIRSGRSPPQPPALRPRAERCPGPEPRPEPGGRVGPQRMAGGDGPGPAGHPRRRPLHSGDTAGNFPLPLRRGAARGALGRVGTAPVVSTRLGEPLSCLTAAGGLGTAVLGNRRKHGAVGTRLDLRCPPAWGARGRGCAGHRGPPSAERSPRH